jgi:hypothetical protein
MMNGWRLGECNEGIREPASGWWMDEEVSSEWWMDDF